MTTDTWLESASTTLGAILTDDYGLHVDRAILATTLDRRRMMLATSMSRTPSAVESMLDEPALREIASHMARARELHDG